MAFDLLSFFMAAQARLTYTAKEVYLKDNGGAWQAKR
jgi:hypothetical protein